MTTIDMHVHLLNPNVKFDRFFDRVALKLFGKKFNFDLDEIKQNPYEGYKKAFINSLKNSRYVDKVVLLPVDSEYNEQGVEVHRDKTVCSLSEDVLEVYREFPDLIIPFMSVNPRRKDAIELLEYYKAQGCVGVKFLQNYWGVDLRDESLKPYYKKLVELDLPLIIHIGSEYSIKSDKRYESWEMLTFPLECGVRVIAAHVGVGDSNGGLFFWRNFSNNPKYFNKDYFQILDLMKKYDNLYADLSAILTIFKSRVLRDLSTRGVEERLLFATDYPVVFSTIFCSYDLSLSKRFWLNKIKNPYDRYIRTIFEYFPENSPIYTNYKKILKI